VLLILAVAAAGAYVVAGRGAPPHLTINKPDRPAGQPGSPDVTAEAPNGKFSALTIALEQNRKTVDGERARFETPQPDSVVTADKF
jgi:hypothetical protein